jgi:hypothetical protein
MPITTPLPPCPFQPFCQPHGFAGLSCCLLIFVTIFFSFLFFSFLGAGGGWAGPPTRFFSFLFFSFLFFSFLFVSFLFISFRFVSFQFNFFSGGVLHALVLERRCQVYDAELVMASSEVRMWGGASGEVAIVNEFLHGVHQEL